MQDIKQGGNSVFLKEIVRLKFITIEFNVFNYII